MNTSPHLNRRGFLAGLSASAAGLGLVSCSKGAKDGCAQPSEGGGVEEPGTPLADSVLPFDGEHQSGIAQAPQAYGAVLAFNARPGKNIDDMRRLLRLWTEDARRLSQSVAPLGDLEKELVAIPANLTFTAGAGPRFFNIIGKPQLRPEWLRPIPVFKNDRLDPRWGEADLVVQICCDDAVTLAHAVRHIVRSGADYVTLAWNQQGFSNADGALREGMTARNLFGQLDGTINPHSPEEFADQVWIKDGPEWLRGGTCMVIRRIAMDIDEWEILDRPSREMVIGRNLVNGAPLSGGEEHTAADFDARDETGLPLIDPFSHMARSHPPEHAPHQKLLRRPFSYDLPPEPGSEKLSNSGLLFICFQKNPDEQFTPIQKRLDEGDRLNQWITHIGSAVFFIFPGVDEKTYWGQGLIDETPQA